MRYINYFSCILQVNSTPFVASVELELKVNRAPFAASLELELNLSRIIVASISNQLLKTKKHVNFDL